MASTNPEPVIHALFEPNTSTWQYIVADPVTREAVIIDPVLDFDPSRNAISTKTADGLLALVSDQGYTIMRLLETHAHADHLTAAKYLQHRLSVTGAAETGDGGSGSKENKPLVCIGKRIVGVQERFARRYGIDRAEYEGVFDCLLDDDEVFRIGQLEAKAIHLPGHTPDHMGYMIGDNVFCGDSIFNYDVGSARCDFPDGDAHQLYHSVTHKLFSLPDHVKIWTGHDYPPPPPPPPPQPATTTTTTTNQPREPLAYTTVGDQKRLNKHLKTGTAEDTFVAWRNERDAGLGEPRLLHQSLQFNIRAGRLPSPSSGSGAGAGGGDRLIHVPLKVSGEVW